MNDVSSFALEIAKLATTGAISAWVVSRIACRKFLRERHWETKFEHYNLVFQAMTRVMTELRDTESAPPSRKRPLR